MLIYNHNKTLVGIDDETLHHLGYKTLASFLEAHDDVAELFVKKPGYIHNFQNFPWIDFVLHADAEDTKAIIQNDKKHFSCVISITPIFLTDAPEQEGYVVHLKQIKSLNGEEAAFVRESPESETMPEEPADDLGVTLPGMESMEPTVLSEPDTFDIPDIPPIDLPDITADNPMDETPSFEEPAFTTPQTPPAEPEPFVLEEMGEPASEKPSERPMLGDYINKEEASYLEKLRTPKEYVYNPQIAADELGLPVELIEEFIGDFIQQAHDFKEDLFDAALKEDFDEVHILSHKLKGVAANLRIEDAFEVLSIINNSRDQVEIEANLKQFYRIVAKMEGKDLPDFSEYESEGAPPETALDETDDDDIYDIGMLLDDTPTTPPPAESASPVETPDASAETPVETPETAPAPAEISHETPGGDEEEDEMLSILQIPEEEPSAAAETTEPAPVRKEDGDNDLFDLDILSDETVPSEPETPPAPPAEPESEPLRYDIKQAAFELGLKEEFIRSLLDEFVSDAKSKKNALLEAIEKGDDRTVQSFTFEFKGLADNLRIAQLSDLLKELRQAGQPDRAKAVAERLYAMLEQL